jgi:hypothetical protein
MSTATTLRRSARLASKPRVSYSFVNDSTNTMTAFLVSPEMRTDFEHMLVDETLQNLSYARYVRQYNKQQQENLLKNTQKLYEEMSKSTNEYEKNKYFALKNLITHTFGVLYSTSKEKEILLKKIPVLNNLILQTNPFMRDPVKLSVDTCERDYHGHIIFTSYRTKNYIKGLDHLTKMMDEMSIPNYVRAKVLYRHLDNYLKENNYPFKINHLKNNYYCVVVERV